MSKLLVIQLSRLGDLIQTLPLLKRLKQLKENCHITLFCLRELSEIIQDSPLVDHVVCLSAKELVNLQHETMLHPSRANDLSQMKELRETYDLIINLTHNLIGGRICELVKGKRKTGGINTFEKEIRYLGDWAKYMIAFSRNRPENLFSLVDMYIGTGDVPHGPIQSYLEISKDKQDSALKLLTAGGYKRKGKLIAFQMGANKLHRVWPIENFSLLANELMRDNPVEFVVLGTEKESELCERFRRLSNVSFIDLTGKTTLADLAAVLQQCDLLVSNDTGTIHVAAAIKTKTLGLYFSSAYFTETGPYGEGNICLQVELPCSPCHEKEICEDIKCKSFLTVRAVKKAVEIMLEGENDFEKFDFENLAVYQSRFLTNGTLAYIPIAPSRVSNQYQLGFLNRLMWEATLGIDPDRSFLEELTSRIGNLEGLKNKATEYASGLHLLKELYSQGIESAQEIMASFTRRPINQVRILSKSNDLNSIETDISKLNQIPGILRDFHTMEILDTDCLQFPELAVQYSKKYKKLQGIAETFLSQLNVIFG